MRSVTSNRSLSSSLGTHTQPMVSSLIRKRSMTSGKCQSQWTRRDSTSSMTCLSQFIRQFADKAQLLCDLLKQDVPWTWDEDHDQHFEALKLQASTGSCLKYNDPTRPVSLEVDASQRGLGVALVQDGYPVAFASKTLTDTVMIQLYWAWNVGRGQWDTAVPHLPLCQVIHPGHLL